MVIEDIVKSLEKILEKNSLVAAFLMVGLILYGAYFFSKKITRNTIPGAAIAISLALVLAYFGGEKGLASIPVFAGLGVLGAPMMRDFAIVATALGASFDEIKKTGWIGFICLFVGTAIAFFVGAIIAYCMGYTDAKSMATIGGGACTFIVGPITGGAVGASSDVIAISIAIGVIKSITITIFTPFVAKRLLINNPQAAMVFGALVGSTSGVSAGLAATDIALVPYGALTATFHTALGCLLCPSLLYFILHSIV
ncbi:MAG: hypothetical protein RLZZ605_1052 [Bacteroidota bacterium]|jgi:malonate transporter MadM subunit